MGNDEAEWRVDVTDDDIRAAKRAWHAADDSSDEEETARRYATYRQLVMGQAQQIADDFRARRAS